jgi:hypothetical protein
MCFIIIIIFIINQVLGQMACHGFTQTFLTLFLGFFFHVDVNSSLGCISLKLESRICPANLLLVKGQKVQ